MEEEERVTKKSVEGLGGSPAPADEEARGAAEQASGTPKVSREKLIQALRESRVEPNQDAKEVGKDELLAAVAKKRKTRKKRDVAQAVRALRSGRRGRRGRAGHPD